DAILKAYSRSDLSVFDRFGGLLNGKTFEHFYAYFSSKVGIEFDAGTQVTRLSVSAFAPRDAQMINQRLLGDVEKLVNRLNTRAQEDTI
ncbi:hypothetical protein OVW16_26560, partial [Klebsiella pneumoniae]|nr:hypothetical protein [Klebsiella pneumoniae]